MDTSDGRSFGWLGLTIIVILLLFSMAISVYHVSAHEASLLPTILGQGELLFFTVLFGIAGYYALTNANGPRERYIIGVRAGIGYVLSGLLAGGYAYHQHLTPEAVLDYDAILFQALFVALVGGTAGVFVGFEKARHERTIARLADATQELETTEAEIRTEKQRFESLFQNAPTAIADIQYTDGEPIVDQGNASFEDLLGQTSTGAEAENLFEVVPLEETATEQEVAAHVREKEIYEGEVTVERSGAPGYYKLRVIPYEVGKVGDRAFALYTDVTDLRKTREELEESVEQLEVSNERLEQFAYAVSHDLEEPLRMISSYLKLLEDRYRDDLNEDAQDFIDFAVDGADRMRSMIDSLLEYSRVTTHGKPMEPTDAEAVLDDVLTDLQPRIKETDATITKDDLPTVVADSDQLAQVFRNLVSNALDYSGDVPPRVHIGVERENEEWRFAVKDQGVGIDPDQQDRIFEVFESVHTAEEGSGSGLGLALCQRIVERHGGTIWVESEPSEGATFYFTLPLTDEQQTAPPNQAPIQSE